MKLTHKKNITNAVSGLVTAFILVTLTSACSVSKNGEATYQVLEETPTAQKAATDAVPSFELSAAPVQQQSAPPSLDMNPAAIAQTSQPATPPITPNVSESNVMLDESIVKISDEEMNSAAEVESLSAPVRSSKKIVAQSTQPEVLESNVMLDESIVKISDEEMNSAAEVERSSPVKRSKTAKKKHVAVASAMAADGEPSSEYVVKAGDTLMKVSWNVYRDIHLWRRIYEQNESVISNPMQLTAGTRLKVDAPQGEYVGKGEPFLIKTGDTLGSISGEVYGVREKWRKIWDNNRELIHDPNRIYAGFMLYYLPESTVPPDSQRITQAPAKTQQEEAPQLSPTSPSSIVEEVPARQPSSTTPPSTP
jgi:hypothetical protein